LFVSGGQIHRFWAFEPLRSPLSGALMVGGAFLDDVAV
jgi:hypothetical protein